MDQARAAGRALPAPGRGRARQRGGRGRARARSARCRARGRCAACGENRVDRGMPAALVHQSGARSVTQGHYSKKSASAALLHLVRSAARDQGVRAHLDYGGERLRDAHRRALPQGAAQGSRRRRRARAPAPHAVERRAHHRRGGGRAADPHHRVGARRRGGRCSGPRARQAHAQDHQLRHGRHDGESGDGRGRRGDARPRILGRRRHHDRLAAPHRRGLHAEGAGDRPRRGWRRRRLARMDRCRRRAAGRPGKRRRSARPGVLRQGRRDADAHRRQPAPRLHQPGASRRRRAQAQCRQSTRRVY